MIAVDAGPGLHVGVKDFRGLLCGDIPDSPDVSLRELQFGRVHKACLDEGAGLASAFAVVFRIDEATVVTQILKEIAARGRESDGSWRE